MGKGQAKEASHRESTVYVDVGTPIFSICYCSVIWGTWCCLCIDIDTWIHLSIHYMILQFRSHCKKNPPVCVVLLSFLSDHQKCYFWGVTLFVSLLSYRKLFKGYIEMNQHESIQPCLNLMNEYFNFLQINNETKCLLSVEWNILWRVMHVWKIKPYGDVWIGACGRK